MNNTATCMRLYNTTTLQPFLPRYYTRKYRFEMSDSETQCKHLDVRTFDSVRCCLACGAAVIDPPPADPSEFSIEPFDITAPKQYEYKDLNFELGQEVRLVVLKPGSSSEPIRCEIIHVNLESDPDFEAVSYTWATERGDDKKSEIIHCPGGTVIPVTVNCAAALRQLRHPTHSRRLWIDAICIHQDNVRERMHQVGLMGGIYSKALRVMICIGDSETDYSSAFEYLKGDSNNIDGKELARQMLTLRWFCRVWVIQEVALAAVAVMVCNGHTIMLTEDVVARISASLPAHQKLPGPLLWNPGSNIGRNHEGRDLLACLQATRSSLATDPRDKIYGIHSLLNPESRALIDIDYASGVAEVFTKAAAVVVRERQSLDIILRAITSRRDAHISGPLSPDSVDGLPSWVPNWYQDTSIWSCQFESEVLGPWKSTVDLVVDNSREREPPTEQLDSSGVTTEMLASPSFTRLRVRAHFIDVIVSIDYEQLMGFMACRQFFTLVRHLIEGAMDPLQTLPLDQELPQDQYRHVRSDSNRIIQLMHRCGVPGGQDLGALFKEWQTRYSWHSFENSGYGTQTRNNTVFRTRYSIGHTPSHYTAEALTIFAVDGVRDPLILQKTETNEHSYKIIDGCYLLAALELDRLNTPHSTGLWNYRGPLHPLHGWSGMIELE
ncbi:unnamed protein product [Periconia digitata]|uniref:Heterokaryon incompatibility domain-containing protein n=1 Tax=Periconia digitata TaxID=1303443 RepID=A0A9W4UGQ4_9PLEO|nr:unnamed protein product [Periconia digitata]